MGSDVLAELTPRPTLLLVDDDPTFCGVLAQALKKRGFDVQTATDVVAGVTLAEAIEPEYAVIDLRIGQESGLVLPVLGMGHWRLALKMLMVLAARINAPPASDQPSSPSL